MKTTIYILATLVAMQSSILCAGTPDLHPRPGSPSVKLAPVPPREATFEETVETMDLSTYKPVTPMEADFPEESTEKPDRERFVDYPHNELLKFQALNTGNPKLTVPSEADFE